VKFSYNNLQQKPYIWLKAFLGKKKEKKTFTQNDKHNKPHRTCLSLLPKATPSPSALLQEMLILAQSISSSAQYVTLKKDFLTSKFSYSLFFRIPDWDCESVGDY